MTGGILSHEDQFEYLCEIELRSIILKAYIYLSIAEIIFLHRITTTSNRDTRKEERFPLNAVEVPHVKKHRIAQLKRYVLIKINLKKFSFISTQSPQIHII